MFSFFQPQNALIFFLFSMDEKFLPVNGENNS